MVWNVFFVFIFSMWVVSSMEDYYQPPRSSAVWGYFTPPLLQNVPLQQTPMEAMVELTNNLGVGILQYLMEKYAQKLPFSITKGQNNAFAHSGVKNTSIKDHSFSRGNFAFSPYGVASVLVVLYEGARGESARQIHRAVGFPYDKDIIRVGFRDIHRHLRDYFSHEGYLSGISLNKQSSSLKPEYKKILKFYGYDVDLNQFDDDDDSDSGNNTPETSASSTSASPPQNETTTAGDAEKNVTKPVEQERNSTTTSLNAPTTTLQETTTEEFSQSSTETQQNNGDTGNGTSPVEGERNTTVSFSTVPTTEQETPKPVFTTEGFSQSSTEPQQSNGSTNTEEESNNNTSSTVPTTQQETSAEVTQSTIEPQQSNGSTNTAEEESNNNTSSTVPTTQQETDAEVTQSTTAPQQTNGSTNTEEEEESNNNTSSTVPTTQQETGAEVTQSTTEPQQSNGSTNTEEESSNNTSSTASITQQETNTEVTETSTEPQQSNGFTTAEEEESNSKTSSTISPMQQETVTEVLQTSTEPQQSDNDAFNVTNLVEENMLFSTMPTVQQETVTVEFLQNSTETEQIKTDTTIYNETTTVMSTSGLPVLTTTEDDSEFQINLTIDNEYFEGLVNQTQETTTANEVEEITNVSIDNGMLIPQPDDRETTTTKVQSTVSITEDFTSTTERKKNASVAEIRDIMNSKASLWLGEKPQSREKRTITDYLKSPQSLDLSLQLQNGMYDTHVSRNADLYRKLPRLLFLVDGAVDTPVPMMIYTNVFSYAYIPRLHAKALEFPLDDVRYKLLIILPVERRGLRQLIYDLADYPLSNVLETVRPARVKAMVPTFMVEGFVILTSSLQKLGIWDVFDPRKANLSGMSTDPELYVRNVEQSVTVVIRNYVEILDIQTRTMAARQMEYEFEATHPFLYFVLDTDTNVALMAGQILDPLNSRIY